MELSFTEDRPKKGIAVLSVEGRLNAVTAGELKDKLKRLVSESVYHIVLELAGVTFIDSSGLSAIVSGLKSVREHAGSLKLVGLSPTTKRVFELTRLDRILEFYQDVEEAIANAVVD